MITNITNFLRSGLYDWVVQRASAVVLAAYAIFLLGYPIAHPNISYADWHGLFPRGRIRILGLLIPIALSVHAWVGMWVISTDYLISMVLGKVATVVRFLSQVACGMAMFIFFI